MPSVGTASHPLRVAIIGAGPAGFYAAGHLLGQSDLTVEVDLFDKLPTPHGLVRAGVAPDHQKIKNVTRVFDRIAALPGFRFFGNVCLGEHVTVDDLERHYHQILYATGAQTDRSLGIPGEDLDGSHSATEFVAWYNGHPEFKDRTFDLAQERVAVIGVGNVAIDVARILCRTPEELERTDIADYALDALRASRVREVFILGRRGPAQAKFTNAEIKELGELDGADVRVPPDEAELDPLSAAELENAPRPVMTNVEIVQDYARRPLSGKPKRLTIRFLVSPVEVLDDGTGHVGGLKLVRNRLVRGDDGSLRPQPTDTFETLPVGLVFRSVGYRGVPLPGVPFHDRQGVIPNDGGRILDDDRPVVGQYVAGWIKRGPTGVIGTNKADAVETVEHMLEDLREGRLLDPPEPSAEAVLHLIRSRRPCFFSYADWQRLDEIETTQGRQRGRPRVKLTCAEDMLAALGRTADCHLAGAE
ncbi:NADP oxidoreductase [Rhodothermaceae bacterium RA]|nr:NADP oxidoreductase [Rhodothermaceae bacterium RA]